MPGMTDWTTLAAAMAAEATATDKQEFGSFFLLRLLGMAVSYEGDACIVQFDATPGLANPRGTLHGGMLATAMDISMGHLLQRTAGAGATVEMKVQYMAAVTDGPVRCTGSFLRRGRSICFMQSLATGADGSSVAHATATWRVLPSSPSPAGGRGPG
jgi:uncharacterized protein (TIGR00369 family)